jgi:NAD(P)-dependent dehydrogenase (short-subunit alcohol dehydrogenase family)
MGILDAKVVIVIGAARGRGEAEARLFVAEGAKVMLTDVLLEGGSVAEALGDLPAFHRTMTHGIFYEIQVNSPLKHRSESCSVVD